MLTNDSSASPNPAPVITVAMLTYRRTKLLATAIVALDDACAGYPRSEVLIVDNDPDGSAGPFVGEFAERSETPTIRYVHEPRPGISAARNRALDEARGDLMVFIDDDELPTPGWLDNLVATYSTQRPTAVAGPVRHEFEVPPDPWTVAGEFFARRRNRTGTRVQEAATNNLLLDLGQVRALGARFDDRLGLTGGEDSLFTKQLVKSGGSILWCDAAEVIALVPRSRISRQWVIRRAFRLANTGPRVDLMMADSLWSRARTRSYYIAGGLVRIGSGGLRSLGGAITGNLRHRAHGIRMAIRGTGMLTGALGYSYAEYGRKAASAPGGTATLDVAGDPGSADAAD